MHNQGSLQATQKNTAFIILVIILAAFLRLYHLGSNAFWYDESFALLNNFGLDKLPHPLKLFDPAFLIHNHYYLMLYNHGFLHYYQLLVGSGEFALRTSSVIFSLLSIVSLYLIVKKYISHKVAWISLILISIAPFQIHYAQELRPYAAIALLSLLSAYSLLAWIHKRKIKYLFTYAVLNILGIYFHYIMLLVLFAFLFFLIIRNKINRGYFKQLIITHVIIFVFILPVILNMLPNIFFIMKNKISSTFSEFPIWAGDRVTLKYLLFTLKNFSIGYNVNFFSLIGRASTFLYGALLFLGVAVFRKNLAMQIFVAVLFVPVIVLFTASLFKTCYVDRYLFASSPFFIIVVAVGLSLFKRKLIFFFLVAIIIFNAVALQKYYSNHFPFDTNQHTAVYQKHDFREIIKYLGKHYRKSDRIMYTCKNAVFPSKLYIRRYSTDGDLIKEMDRGTVVFLPFGSNKLLTFDYSLSYAVTPTENEYSNFLGVAKNKRLWLVFSSWDFPIARNNEYAVLLELKKILPEIGYAKFKDASLYLFEGGNS